MSHRLSSLTRRDFLRTTSALAASRLLAATPTEAEPILDVHQHTRYGGDASRRRSDQQLVAHQAYHKVTTTVLQAGEGWMLSECGDNASCVALQADYPDRFVRFACADPAESRALDVLQGNVKRGAIGFGELKFPVAIDSPEMHRVYKLAEELGVPLLIHFQYETYNTGIERFEAVLKAYPKVNFIAHAQTWWGNISVELNPLILYPKGPVKPGGLTNRLLADYPPETLNSPTVLWSAIVASCYGEVTAIVWTGKEPALQTDTASRDAPSPRCASLSQAMPCFAGSSMRTALPYWA